MMNLAVELPPSCFSMQDLTDFDFVIASHCLENPQYLQFYRNQRPGIRKLVLDNGAFETGKAIPSEDYLRLIGQLKPDVVVLPDVVDNKEETLKASLAFVTEVVDANPALFTGVELMGVLQGLSPMDYMDCANEYAKNPSIGTIGIPYHHFYRPKFIRKYKFDVWAAEMNIKIHILGLPNPFEAVELALIKEVESIDTSLPVVSGQLGLSFKELQWQSARLDLKGDFVRDFRSEDIRSNISFLHDLCHGKASQYALVKE